MSGCNIPKPSKRPKTPDKIADKIVEQLRQDASAYSQGFADGYRLAKKALITCKDCKHYTGKWCTKFSTKQFDLNDICKTDDDYCSMAERKEE